MRPGLTEISFKASKEDYGLLNEIAERGVKLAPKWRTPAERGDYKRTVLMDLTATNANGCPLRLAEFLAAPDGDFGHDFFGIVANIDRTTGTLQNCFVPRYAMPTPREEQTLGEQAEREEG